MPPGLEGLGQPGMEASKHGPLLTMHSLFCSAENVERNMETTLTCAKARRPLCPLDASATLHSAHPGLRVLSENTPNYFSLKSGLVTLNFTVGG